MLAHVFISNLCPILFIRFFFFWQSYLILKTLLYIFIFKVQGVLPDFFFLLLKLNAQFMCYLKFENNYLIVADGKQDE